VLVARRTDRLQELASELEASFGPCATCIATDLAAPGAARALAKELAARALRVDTLVNNAGFGYVGDFVDEPMDNVEDMTRLNIGALTELTRLLLPAMKERGRGRILNVASVASFIPGPRMAVYFATKAYVLSFSDALGQELKGTGVSVTALCPGPTPTEFQAVAGMGRHYSGASRSLAEVDAPSVARAGYRALMKGKRSVIPGFFPRMGVRLAGFLPRGLVLKLLHRVNS
jgi:short-subunit dehydrogenase